MSAELIDNETMHLMPHIECGNCQRDLPLRLTATGERAAVWLCSECSVPFVALCVEAQLPEGASTVRLDDRYFDTTDLPEIGTSIRRQVASLAQRAAKHAVHEKRRSNRIAQSLVVPAVRLGSGFVPEGMSFQLMVANLSAEGIGLVHNSPIDAKYIALELDLDGKESIQVIVRLVRQRLLEPPFHEIGGEFYVRLGSQMTAN